MARNKRLLLKAAKRIEEIPESFDQRTFGEADDRAPCGTVACLAGEIIICSEPSVKKGVAKLNAIVKAWQHNGGTPAWPGDVAGDLAGLTEQERRDLFISATGGTWPSRFRRKTAQGRARTAPKLLRHLAEGGKV